MRWKYSAILIGLIVLILTLPSAQALQMQAEVPSDWAYISGIVTYNGEPQDGAYVRIPGATTGTNTFTTQDGGYYKVSTYPRLVTSVEVSYFGVTVTRSVETGGEGSNTTFNFDLTGPSDVVAATPTVLPETIVLTGEVVYGGRQLGGAVVNISPITKVKTDSTGHYTTVVPTNENLTITVMTDAGPVTKSVTSPAEGTSFAVDFAVRAATATPQVTPTSAATPVPLPKSGSESLVILSALGLLAAIGLIRLRKE